MKFPLFNKKDNLKNVPVSDLQKTFEEKFLQRLPLPAATLKINYTMVCDHGRSGENFAAKLAEEGNSVSYVKTGDKKYIINVVTEPQRNATEDKVRELLTKIAENGMKYNCLLTNWDYILPDN